jgi:hypothetical protein
MCDRPPAASVGGAEDAGKPRHGAAPGGIGAQPTCGCRVAARPSAMQCVDTAFTGHRQAARDVRQLAPGLALVATSRTEGAVPPMASGCSNKTPHLYV